jgi:hypothetical protein
MRLSSGADWPGLPLGGDWASGQANHQQRSGGAAAARCQRSRLARQPCVEALRCVEITCRFPDAGKTFPPASKKKKKKYKKDGNVAGLASVLLMPASPAVAGEAGGRMWGRCAEEEEQG